MKTKIVTTTLFAASLALTAACTTVGRRSTVSEADKDSPEQVVVGQPNRQGAVVSAHERQYWIGLRQSKKALPRIHGALATGEAEAAVDLARSYLAKHPGDVQGLTLLAAALAMSRNYEMADYYAGLALKLQPGNAAALNIRGVALMLQPKNRVADYRRAADYFERAIAGDDNQIAAGMNLGALQLELGDAAAALATYDGVVKRCGACAEGLMGQGIAASRSRSFDKAKAAFEAVLAKNARHPGALYHLALVHKNGYNDRKQAEKYLFALLNDSRGQADQYMKERAHSVLRAMKGEKDVEDRAMIADQDGAPASDDDKDAELLMSSSEMEAE